MQLKSEKESSVVKIGITGGIGSGKTIVTKIFEALGIPVYYADERARWIQDNDKEVISKITEVFGEKAYLSGTLNRPFITSQVFGDKDKLQQLNSIVHPKVGRDFEDWARAMNNYPYVVKEAALFFEAGSNKDMDKMITVSSPLELRIIRILKRDPHRTEADIRAIISKQLSDDEKVKLADYVIYNDEVHLLIPQVLKIDHLLRQL